MAKKKSVKKARVKAKVKKAAPRKAKTAKAKPKAKAAKAKVNMVSLGLDLRYPYTGFRYRAEGPQRVRVDRGDLHGYFDADGRWLEGPLKSADGPFCRYMTSNWVLAVRAGKIPG